MPTLFGLGTQNPVALQLVQLPYGSEVGFIHIRQLARSYNNGNWRYSRWFTIHAGYIDRSAWREYCEYMYAVSWWLGSKMRREEWFLCTMLHLLSALVV